MAARLSGTLPRLPRAARSETRHSLPRRFASTARLAAAARLERSSAFWPAERLERLQRRRLRAIVSHAYESVPFYREAMDSRGLRPGDIATAEDLATLPLIDANDVRADPERYTSTRISRRDVVDLYSGGTSATRRGKMSWEHRAILKALGISARERVVLNELACDGHRISLARELVSRAALGKLSDPRQMHQRVFIYPAGAALWRMRSLWADLTVIPTGGANQHFIDDVIDFERTADRFDRIRPRVAFSYGSYADQFLRFVRARRRPVALPRVWLVSADMVTPTGRDAAAELGVRLYSSYAATETGTIGFQCERLGGLHLNVDAIAVRIAGGDGATLRDGESGDVVVSNLINGATVLLNYAIGDRAALTPERCPCGRSLPLLGGLEGRRSDLIRLRGGRELSSLSVEAALKSELEAAAKMQFVQDEPGRITLRVVPLDGVEHQSLSDSIVSRARAELGNELDVTVELVPEIPRTARGKFRTVVSTVDAIPA